MPLPGRPLTGRLLLGATVPWWRRSRRRVGRWLVALALAALAAGVVQVRADDAARTLAGLGRTRAVVVARRDLAPGHVVGDDDTLVRALPVDAVPEAALDAAPTGRTVTAAIVAGEVVSPARLAPAGTSGLAALVPADRRAIAIPVEGTGLQVEIGDRVDVLGPADGSLLGDDGDDGSGGSGGPAVVARGALVLAAGDTSVTVAVDRDEAGAVAAALARGTPVLALAGALPDR